MSSSLVSITGTSRVSAGAQINANDFVEVCGYDTNGYSCSIVDYAAKTAITGAASSVSFGFTTTNLNRNPIGMSQSGAVFTACYSTGAAPNSLTLFRASPLGVTYQGPDSALVDPVTAQQNTVTVLPLSNDTMLTVWSEGSANPYNIYFAITDLSGNILVAKTSVDAAVSGNLVAVSNYSKRLGLTGTGFSIAYQSAASNDQIHFAAYDNFGNVVANGPATTILTFGAVGAAALVDMKLLPNGNLAVAAVSGSGTAGSIGVFVGVVSSAGAVVTAITNQLATTDATIATRPQIEVAAGGTTFAVVGGVTAWKVAVFTLAGAIVGAQHTTGAASVVYGFSRKLVYSAGQYNLLWSDVTNTNTPVALQLTQIPVTGTNYVEGVILAAAGVQVMDAIDGQNMLVYVCAINSTTLQYCVIGLPTVNGLIAPVIYSPNGLASFTAGGTTTAACAYLSIMPGGDFTFLFATDNGGAGTAYGIGYQKFAPTAPVGVALASGAAGTLIPLADGLNKTYAINYLGGSSAATFNATLPSPPTSQVVSGREGLVGNKYVSFSG